MYQDDRLTPEHCARGRITLFETAAGGLTSPLPGRTPSMLAVFDAVLDEGDSNRVELGMLLVTDRPHIGPGMTDLECDLNFWADVARIYAIPGAPFDLWYHGIVGSGLITNLC